MIFITVGSQKFQFNRLLKEVDLLLKHGCIKDEVFAQIGNSDYIPKHYKYKKFLNQNEYLENIERCDVIICHGGTGAIIGGLKKGKKVIAVPRLEKYEEHVDNHQLQITEQFKNMGLIETTEDIKLLKDVITKIKQFKEKKYISNTNKIINSIERFLEES